jgi:HTH-type transcriptional regulator/antitoxin HigA
MAAKTANHTLPATYFKLAKKFPLTHISDDDHLAKAQQLVDRLLQEDLNEGSQAYLDALTDLVETYENKHVLIPDASEADVLRELMWSNDLSQTRLARAVGISQSTVSAVLSGGRSLTKQQLVRLAKFFQVSPAVFLPG